MNVTLNAEEILCVYETLLKSKNTTDEQDKIIAKFRKPILSALEKEQDKIDATMYQAWTENEVKKIEELTRENASMKIPLPRVASRGKR